jgi:predicted nucleotidyltransferase
MKLIFKSIFGSHLYGLQTEKSDMDFKAIYIPELDDILLSRQKEAINTSSKTPDKIKNDNTDVDSEIFSVQKFMKMLLQGQAVAIDMFFTPDKLILERDSSWNLIKENKEHWLHKNILPYIGYCRQQASKYGIKGSRANTLKIVRDTLKELNQNSLVIDYWYIFQELAKLEHCEIIFEDTRNMNDQWMFMCCGKKIQQHIKINQAFKLFQKLYDDYGVRAKLAEKNEGIDWKSLSHAVRVADQGIELLQTGNISFPLINRDYILNVKQGLIPFQEISKLLDQRFVELEEASLKSYLPETPNHDKMNEIILEIYKSEYFQNNACVCQ